MPDVVSSRGSHFFTLPSTKLGRVSAGLFLVGLVVFAANLFVHPGTSPRMGPLAAVMIVGFGGAIVTGAVALIWYHERSWAVWAATLLVVLVLTADVIAGLLGLGG
jgi:hypothetical protein